MDSNYKAYDHLSSYARIDAILSAPAGNFEEVNELPDRDRLTYTNGFYAYCSALFADIRDSSELPKKFTRPVLAKIYRAFISEMVAVMNGEETCREINIVGDCVWAVYNTPYKRDIDGVFSVSARVNSLRKVLDYKYRKAGYEVNLSVGIGMAYGRALMIKAGFSGSGIADVVYMGDVVNRTAKLAAQGSKGWGTPPMMIDEVFAQNLNEDNSKLLTMDWNRGCYTSRAVNVAMEDWYNKNCV